MASSHTIQRTGGQEASPRSRPAPTESRGASNAKAKRELGWTPRYPSWRQGFAAAYGQHPLKTAA